MKCKHNHKFYKCNCCCENCGWVIIRMCNTAKVGNVKSNTVITNVVKRVCKGVII